MTEGVTPCPSVRFYQTSAGAGCISLHDFCATVGIAQNPTLHGRARRPAPTNCVSPVCMCRFEKLGGRAMHAPTVCIFSPHPHKNAPILLGAFQQSIYDIFRRFRFETRGKSAPTALRGQADAERSFRTWRSENPPVFSMLPANRRNCRAGIRRCSHR